MGPGGAWFRIPRERSARFGSHDIESSPAGEAGDVGGGHEILGFALTAAMAAEIGSLDLVTIVDGLPIRTLTLVSQPTASYDELVSALARRRVQPAVCRTDLRFAALVG